MISVEHGQTTACNVYLRSITPDGAHINHPIAKLDKCSTEQRGVRSSTGPTHDCNCAHRLIGISISAM